MAGQTPQNLEMAIRGLMRRDVDLCRAVVADGAALPFADAEFDAVHHSDVLC